MNLEDLKAHSRATKEFEWCGKAVRLRKLSAQDYMALFGRIRQEESKDRTPEQDQQATIEFHVELVARTWAGDDGELQANSEEGRAALRTLPFDELLSFGRLSLKHSGFDPAAGEQKKSDSPTPNCSPSISAAPSDTPASIPTSFA